MPDPLLYKSGKPRRPATRKPKPGGWRKKVSNLQWETGLMSTKLGGFMETDEEGLTYIVVVRHSITFYIWREDKGKWCVSAYDVDFNSHATFSRAADITLFMLAF